MRHDGLEPVVLAAEAVHGDDRRLGVRRAVDPVGGGRRRATSTSRRSTGIASSSAEYGFGDGHPSSLRARPPPAVRLGGDVGGGAYRDRHGGGTRPEPLRALRDARRGREVVGVFDLETTGVDVDVRPDRDGARRAARRARARSSAPATGSPIPGIEIPERRDRVHGITTAHARADGAPAREVVERGRRRAARAAGCRHPGRRLQRAVRLLAAQARGDPARHRADRRSVAGHRPARRRQGVRPVAPGQAHARGRRRALRRAARRRARGLRRRGRGGPRRAGARRAVRAVAARHASTSCTPGRSPGRARRRRASPSTSSSIGRLDPEERLDGSWPIR